MKVLVTVSRFIDTMNGRVGQVVSWVTLGLVLVVFTDVVNAISV